MSPIKLSIGIGQRPTYYFGQLLNVEDFLAEQQYHLDALGRQSRLVFHEWGIVEGLVLSRARDRAVLVSPGAAVDAEGNAMRLDEPRELDVSSFRANDKILVSLAYEESSGGADGRDTNRVDRYLTLTAAAESEPRGSGVILGAVTLDAQAKIGDGGIDYTEAKYARLATGSITAGQLHADLRRGWLRLPFRPLPMVEGPEEGNEAGLPAFRVGATEALSPDPKDAGPKDRGAAGTMEIPIPPSVRQITRLRIAGMENKGEISLLLLRGGWDAASRKHVRDVLVEEKIVRVEPYDKIYSVTDMALADHHTLALWVKATRRTAVSLIAVEFAY